MKRTLRAGLCLILALAAALPATAQTSRLAFPAIPRAQKGDSVTICLKSGREITGVVGDWVGTVGFYVKPEHSAAYLIHPEDIVTINTAGGAMRLTPLHTSHRMSDGAKAAIAVFVVIGGVFLVKALSTPIG